MSNEEETVFLEDLETNARKKVQQELPGISASQESGPSASQTSQNGATSTSSSKIATAKETKKRQMTLTDMFSGQGSSKRVKVTETTQSTTSTSSPGIAKVVGASSSQSKPLGTQKLNSIPFSMKAFQASLDEEQQKLLNLECQVLGKSWLKLLQNEIKKPYFISLKRFLWEKGVRGPDDSPSSLKVYPSPKNIYTWSNTPLGRVKVVIIGQDPYHAPGQAHGLSFSVPPGVKPPPSLMNIYQELKNEYPDFVPPKHGNLSLWAESGVLMLNACLTVDARSPGSHAKKGWETFTSEIVRLVDKYGGANVGSNSTGIGRGVVFLAWGAFAIGRVAGLSKTKHLVLTSSHPSPYSADKGFLGNGHFKEANRWLEAKYGPNEGVDWCRLDG